MINLRLETVVEDHIVAVLCEKGWNRTHTAKALGIGIRTLQRRLIKMGLQDVRSYQEYITRLESREEA